MNCHNNNKDNDNHKGHNHSPKKHMLYMLLCCGLPIILIAILPLITRVSPDAAGFVSKIAPFLCPIMMIPMMFMMMGGSNGGGKKKSCCEDANDKNITKEIVKQ